MTMKKIRRALWYPLRHAHYLPTTTPERRLFRRLIPGMLAEAAAPSPDVERWRLVAREAGFQIQVWRYRGSTYWALLEARDEMRGAGAYVIRLGPATWGEREIMLQAPHVAFDRRTGQIAASMFFRPRAVGAPRAFFTNTIPRTRVGGPNEPPGPRHSPADVCHNSRHLFAAATESAARVMERPVVIQLHGYADSSVPPPKGGAPILAIVSASRRDGSSPASTAVASLLETILGDGVRRFPEETRRMGGTLNVIARRLRSVPAASFVHLELSASLRKRLVADGTFRARFGALVLSAATAGTPTVCQKSL